MIIERPSHETIIVTPNCKYIASVEVLYGSEESDVLCYVRFGEVGFSDEINLYPDEFDAFRRLLDEVEAYLKQSNLVELHQTKQGTEENIDE